MYTEVLFLTGFANSFFRGMNIELALQIKNDCKAKV